MNLVLLRGNYPPVLIGPDERAAYLDGIEKRSEGDAQGHASARAMGRPLRRLSKLRLLSTPLPLWPSWGS